MLHNNKRLVCLYKYSQIRQKTQVNVQVTFESLINFFSVAAIVCNLTTSAFVTFLIVCRTNEDVQLQKGCQYVATCFVQRDNPANVIKYYVVSNFR